MTGDDEAGVYLFDLGGSVDELLEESEKALGGASHELSLRSSPRRSPVQH